MGFYKHSDRESRDYSQRYGHPDNPIRGEDFEKAYRGEYRNQELTDDKTGGRQN